jgi:YesN/AraC family two-component response regulator
MYYGFGLPAESLRPTRDSEVEQNVLIADDHAVVRKDLKYIFSLIPDMNVIGEAGTAPETLQAAHNLE